MRKYTYIWCSPGEKRVVASGIESRDVLALLDDRDSVLLLSHGDCGSIDATFPFDPHSRCEFGRARDVADVPQEEVYSWGDCCWVDFPGARPPQLGKRELASLFYFAHMGEALSGPRIRSLKNRFLFYGHDDGWYMTLYYARQRDAERLLRVVMQHHHTPGDHALLCREVMSGKQGFWLTSERVVRLHKTHDIDALLNSRKYPSQ